MKNGRTKVVKKTAKRMSKKARAGVERSRAAVAEAEVFTDAKPRIITLRFDQIEIDPKALAKSDPRRYGVESIERLAAVIQSVGQINPVVLMQPENFGEGYRIVAGNRRVLACKLSNTRVIARMLRHGAVHDGITISENADREDWNEIELAVHVAQMVETKAAQKQNESKMPAAAAAKLAEGLVAQSLGKNLAWVRDRTYMARLSGEVKKMVVQGRLPVPHAKEIAKLADPTLRDQIAERAAAKMDQEGASPVALLIVKRWVAGHLNNLAVVPWKLSVAFANAPACVDCSHNSANAPGLFASGEEIDGGSKKGTWTIGTDRAGACLNPACFQRKTTEAGTAMNVAVRELVPKLEKDAKSHRPTSAALLASDVIDVASRAVGGEKRSSGARVRVDVLNKDSLAAAAIAKAEPARVKPTPAQDLQDKAERARHASEAAEKRLLQEAGMRLNNRLIERAEPLKAAVKTMKAQFLNRMMCVLLASFTDVWQKCREGTPEQRRVAGDSKEMTLLIGAIAANDGDGVVQVMRLINTKTIADNLGTRTMVEAGIEDAFAEGMGVELVKRPTIEEMVAEIRKIQV